MNRTYKYRLLGNIENFEKVNGWVELCRNLYNTALEQRITYYKQRHEKISCYNQMKQLPELRAWSNNYKSIDAQVLQDVMLRLDKTYLAFFRRVRNGEKAGYPRFKSKERYNSFTLKHNGWEINGKYLTIRKIGKFKLRLSRPIDGIIKAITIRRDKIRRWYVFFICDNVPEKKLSKSDKVIGIDVGIKSFLVDSDNNEVDNPKYFIKSERLLRRRQRTLCRRVKGSNRRNKARILVARVHEKVHNQRLDFLHKTANSYIKNYGTLVFEDLNIKGMVKNHSLAKYITDSSWGTFIKLCTYKAEETGRCIIKIPRNYPSSKTCSSCGAINNQLILKDRQWVCMNCGVLHDRDYNAAKNIIKAGQTLQAQTKENTLSVACEFRKRVSSSLIPELIDAVKGTQ